MDPNIIIVLLLTLFTRGHSLQCYECLGEIGSCESNVTTCQDTAGCASATIVLSIGGTEVKMQSKRCIYTGSCISGSVNLGVARTVTSAQCCNTDLCNSKDVPVYNSNSPNGKQCYYCNDTSCLNTLNCLENEDYCITINGTDFTVKGCISKSYCDAVSQVLQGYIDFSCCKGNLCNSAKSITQNLIFHLWPLFFYILIH